MVTMIKRMAKINVKNLSVYNRV